MLLKTTVLHYNIHFMKKHSVALTAASAVLVGSLSAQSLYNLAPDDTTSESLPLSYTAGVNLGFDDNPTPLLGFDDDEAMYGQAYVGATFLNQGPQTTLNFGAQIGVIHYFDNLDAAGQDVDDTAFTASLYLNWTHRVSERLRFVSRNNLTYELEPDYSVGFQAQRQIGNYFRWSTDNAVGYRWSERLATYTGIRAEGLAFDDFDGGDRTLITLYNDFRYQVSESTVATLTYRYQDVDADAQVTDATNQFVLVGIEHRFSPTSTLVLRGGVQIRDVDNGASGSNPYFEGAVRTQVNERFSVRGYLRYGVEDWQRLLTFPNAPGLGVLYSDTETLRIGFTADYEISQALSLMGGINYAFLDFTEQQSPVGPGDVEEELFNAFIGLNYIVNDNLTMNMRYNFEDLSSDAGRDYDRNRISIGASTTF